MREEEGRFFLIVGRSKDVWSEVDSCSTETSGCCFPAEAVVSRLSRCRGGGFAVAVQVVRKP